ncbi:MAG: hypothetical protein NC483_02905, partial [Ruminococcus sp.]|nr:hypothetical protein [Ruminococcus sp.]
TSKANYRMTASIPLTEGKVTASPYDFKLISMYLNNGDGNYIENKTNTIPSGNYTVNSEKSYCYKTNKDTKDNDAKVYTDELGNHVLKGTSKGSKCLLYFDKKIETAKTISELLNTHYKYKSKRTSENKDFNVPYGETTYGMIFEAEDDYGTSYYFAGNPLDNWVEFGGYYWRIIRINGDGSIRLIYQGRTEDENGNKLELQAIGKETQIGNFSQFNASRSDNMYVGYWYQSGVVSGLKEPSIIYTLLNNWFNSSLLKTDTNNFNKIDLNAGFCGDRMPSTTNTPVVKEGINVGNGSGGTGNTVTYYGAYVRLLPGLSFRESVTTITSPVTPSYSCSNVNDLYTYNKANQGNKILENPVGLITADEVSYAGMLHINSNLTDLPAIDNFLYSGTLYWTITPGDFSSSYGAQHFCVYGSALHLINIDNGLGIRPVINLRSDVKFTGDGTQSNPYKVI